MGAAPGVAGREFPLQSGAADYLLFVDRAAVGVVEAKSAGTTSSPVTEQRKIIEEIERCFSIADEVEKVIDQSFKQAEALRQSILKRAFAGKLVPQDPNDEPAEKLLARVKAEKAKREVEMKIKKLPQMSRSSLL